MKKQVQVKQDEAKPVSTEIMAQSIVDISKAIKVLSTTRLKREAILTLIKDKSGISKSTIDVVINNLEQLEEIWLKK